MMEELKFSILTLFFGNNCNLFFVLLCLLTAWQMLAFLVWVMPPINITHVRKIWKLRLTSMCQLFTLILMTLLRKTNKIKFSCIIVFQKAARYIYVKCDIINVNDYLTSNIISNLHYKNLKHPPINQGLHKYLRSDSRNFRLQVFTDINRNVKS